MKLTGIHLIKQNATEEKIIEAIHSCYNDRCFSTFPYITYKLSSSERAMNQYNSGNCIALSIYVQKYLKANFKLHSYIITASVPKRYQVEGQPHICHVALLIPIAKTRFFIIDCPFYFLKPMFCDLENNSLRHIEGMNIHDKKKENIYYKLQNAETKKGILPNSVECSCYYEGATNDKWSYYTNQTLDPDRDIGKFFMQLKPQPFLVRTKVEKNGDISKVYHLKIDDESNLIFIHYGKEIFKGPINKLPKNIEKMIKKDLLPFLNNFIV
jgi:hypothetical protein